MTPIRVLVADDQAIVRDGLVTVLSLLPDVEVVGEAADGAAALALVATERPDVVLMDLRMPGVDGATATAAIQREHPGVRVLVLTTFADDASIVTALRAGARGYLTKDAGRAELAAAVRAVASGQTTLDASVAALLVANLPDATEPTTGLPAPAAPRATGAADPGTHPWQRPRERRTRRHPGRSAPAGRRSPRARRTCSRRSRRVARTRRSPARCS